MPKRLESREQEFYLIEDEPDKNFEVIGFDDLEESPSLCAYIMRAGFDGYLYKLRAIVEPGKFAECWHCVKKENEPFIKTKKVFKL